MWTILHLQNRNYPLYKGPSSKTATTTSGILLNKLVNMHLDIYGKGHFTVIPLYKFSSDNVVERREKEKHFIQIPKPSLNSDIAKN